MKSDLTLPTKTPMITFFFVIIPKCIWDYNSKNSKQQHQHQQQKTCSTIIILKKIINKNYIKMNSIQKRF